MPRGRTLAGCSRWIGRSLPGTDTPAGLCSEQDRRSGVAAWVRRGLELGAKILYVERPDVPLDRSLTAVLSERKVDSVPAMGVGRLQVDSVREAVDPAWQASVVDEALVAGYPTVRLSGEASTVWTVTSPLEHLQVERA